MPILSVSTKDLTVRRLEGSVTCDEIIQELDRFYQGCPTDDVLWILRQGTLLELNGYDLRRIADFVKNNLRGRVGGRTAIVAEADLEFGFGRMLSNLGEAKEIPVSTRIFRTVAEALEWLGLDALPAELDDDQGKAAGEVGANPISAAR